jgi:hypothetical protein
VRVGRADLAAHLEPVDVRQHDVEDRHLDVRIGPELFERLRASPGLDRS